MGQDVGGRAGAWRHGPATPPASVGHVVGMPSTNASSVLLWQWQSRRGSPLLLGGEGNRVGVAAVVEGDASQRAVMWRIATGPAGASGGADGVDAEGAVDSSVHIRCMTLLPLRRLLLIGADDGVVRVCS